MITTITHFVSQNVCLLIILNAVLIAGARELKKRQEKRIEDGKRALRQSLRTQASQKLILMRRRDDDAAWNHILDQLDWRGPRETHEGAMMK